MVLVFAGRGGVSRLDRRTALISDPVRADRSGPALSVIVPTLNEAATLPSLLADLQGQRGLRLEIIISDGGSTDATRHIAAACPSAQLIDAPRGRGAQLNTGRGRARAPWLLFLHADSHIPEPGLLQRALSCLYAGRPNQAGHFGLKFDHTSPAAAHFYRHLEAKSRLNRPETINGDQGLLISGAFFDALGGYAQDLPFLEDQAISEQIFAHGQWLLLPGALHSSARRFEQEGRAQRYFLMMLIMCARRAKLSGFFEQAPKLYPQQNDADPIKVAPYLRLILQLSEQQPEFWPHMARYTLDNAWQPAFMLDLWLGRRVFLSLHDRWAKYLPRAALEPLLAASLKALFSGPILTAIQHRESLAS